MNEAQIIITSVGVFGAAWMFLSKWVSGKKMLRSELNIPEGTQVAHRKAVVRPTEEDVAAAMELARQADRNGMERKADTDRKIAAIETRRRQDVNDLHVKMERMDQDRRIEASKRSKTIYDKVEDQGKELSKEIREQGKQIAVVNERSKTQGEVQTAMDVKLDQILLNALKK